jgi:hypothetical protein
VLRDKRKLSVFVRFVHHEYQVPFAEQIQKKAES